MIAKEQKEIEFINDCDCLVDYNELSKAIMWYQDKPTARLKHIYIYQNYPTVSIYDKKLHIHRLLMMTFSPTENMDLLQVNHIDGNRNNNDLSNLEWVTPSENVNHAFRYNLRIPMSGENNDMAKLNAKIVTDICDDIMENKYTEQQLANKYNISSSLIHNIKKQKTWKFITEKYNFPKQTEGNVKLTEEDVENICKYILNGYTNTEIAEIFNVSKACIKDIKGKRSWRKITEKYF